MEHRSLCLAAGLILGLSWSSAGFSADTPDPEAERNAAWETRLQQAKALQKEGKVRKTESKQRYEAEKKACFKKFRVTDCQEDARVRYVAATNEARRVENRGLAEERQVKKEKLAAKDAKRVAEAPEREADLKEREADNAAERAEKDAIRDKKLADKAKKAQEGERRHAEEEARRQKKQAKHERQVAEKMEKSQRREAESAN